MKLKHCHVPDSHFDPRELRKGMKVEQEHSDDPAVQKCIAKAHLLESPRYYIELAKMEKKFGYHGYGIIRRERGQFCVRSPNNPRWSGGCYPTRKRARRRLQQVEWFKKK